MLLLLYREASIFFLMPQKNVTYEPMRIFSLFKYRKNMVKYNGIGMQ